MNVDYDDLLAAIRVLENETKNSEKNAHFIGNPNLMTPEDYKDVQIGILKKAVEDFIRIYKR